MNLFEQDIVLPGVVTEIISDYNLGYDTSLFGTTDSVVIIGTAFNGPVGKPVPVYSPEHARYVFGTVYDSKSRKEATLVANIQDAWDRGCRTIYAVRIGGKEIYKDYQLAIDTNLKLRVSGIFPSNLNKDIYMVFNNEAYEMNMQIFKPASRATINEKRFALVDSQDAIMVNKIDLYNGGITEDDELVELIKRVNEYSYNNVIKLSIVDEDGNDVTLSSLEAKTIKVKDMFPGLYTIGRDVNEKKVFADTKISLEAVNGELKKALSLNTNVSVDLPIFDAAGKLHDKLGLTSINQYDFLTVAGKIDEVFCKDKVDYEEVSLNDFEIYKKLGSGYAVNAQIVEVAPGSFRVKEVTDKKIKKTEIKDGLYSMLENLKAKYRVLSNASADTTIKGKLPKKNDFKFARKESVKMLNDTIEIVAEAKNKDFTKEKAYKIVFNTNTDALDFVESAKEENAIYLDKTIRQATIVDSTTFEDIKKTKDEFKEGALFLVKDHTDAGLDLASQEILLYSYTNGSFKCLHSLDGEDNLEGQLVMAQKEIYICSKIVNGVTNSALSCSVFQKANLADVDSKEFAVIVLDNGSFQLVKVEELVMGELEGTILGSVSSILNEDDEDKTIVSLSSVYGEENVITIKSNQFDYITIDEVADILNQDKDFAKLFSVKVLDITKAQNFVEDVQHLPGYDLEAELPADKKITYDTNLLIPFRTEDNFARHLAQHCMYTSMKTSPTHGMIGVNILLDTTLESVANKVANLVDLRLDTQLVAKKGNGTDILDRNNMPYAVGRKVSIIVGQYQVTTNDNYTFISNMAAGYAGMVSKLPLDQSSTCQPISIPGQMYELTNYQLSSLTSAGFVTVKQSYTKGWVITDGITMAPAESAFRRLSSSRIADGIEEIIRGVCEPYIGKQNNLANQNSLRSAIKSELDKLTDRLIEKYSFNIAVNSDSVKQMGIINIDFSIVPIYEIKQINNQITVE